MRTKEQNFQLSCEVAKLFSMDQCDSEYDEQCLAVYELLENSEVEQLLNLVKEGPVEDGNLISKQARDNLVYLKLASKVCCKGEQGFQAATYTAWDVLRRAGEL